MIKQKKIELRGYDPIDCSHKFLTVGELKRFLAGLPDDMDIATAYRGAKNRMARSTRAQIVYGCEHHEMLRMGGHDVFFVPERIAKAIESIRRRFTKPVLLISD